MADTLELELLADDIAAVGEVLAATSPDQPAARWFAYLAYSGDLLRMGTLEKLCQCPK
jgi:hypothetical protein|nr:hypothetical protein [uncultured Albidiferax sp.]